MHNPRYIEKLVRDNRETVETFQRSVMDSVLSLIHCEYMQQMRPQSKPTHRVFVAPISEIQRVLSSEAKFLPTVNSDLLPYISKRLIERPIDGPVGEFFNSAKEDGEPRSNIDKAQAVLESVIIPNIYRYIPRIISQKFDLNNPDNQMFIQDKSLDLFDRKLVPNDMLQYVYEETFINLLMNAGMLVETRVPKTDNVYSMESLNNGELSVAHVIMIANDKAGVCPIYVDHKIIALDGVMDFLNFVTSSAILSSDYVVTSDTNTIKFFRLKN